MDTTIEKQILSISAKMHSESKELNIEKKLIENKVFKVISRNFKKVTVENFLEAGFTKNEINHILKRYQISRFGRINGSKMTWIRYQVYDLISLLNYEPRNRQIPNIFKLKKQIRENHTGNRAKIILFCAVNSKDIRITPALKSSIIAFLDDCSYGEALYFLQEIFKVYENAYPLISEKSSFIQSDDISEEKVDEEEEFDKDLNSKIDVPILSPEEILKLQQDNEELTQDLDNAQALADYYQLRFRDANDRANQVKEEYFQTAKIDVFRDFNSIKNNSTLDNLFIGKKILDAMKSEGWKPDHPDLNDVLYLITLFDQFLKNQDITPIYNTDEIINLNFSEAKNVEYRGSEYLDQSDIKVVKVKTPGWKYKGTIITKPKVIEKKKKKKKEEII